MLFKKKDKNDNKDLAKVAALLIHAAKIDENFENEEKNIITQALLKLGVKIQDIEDIIQQGKKLEENANQILDFTKEVKNMEEKKK